jgi:hypothetical protein
MRGDSVLSVLGSVCEDLVWVGDVSVFPGSSKFPGTIVSTFYTNA